MRAVIEVPQVGQLVAQGVHEARVFERPAGGRVAQPDPDRPVREADAVAALHVGALGLEHAVTQAEPRA